MLILTSDTHQHHPPFEVFNGEQIEHQEVPARVERIMAALNKHQLPYTETNDQLPRKIIQRVHDPAYVDYLVSHASDQTETSYSYPSVFPLQAHFGAMTSAPARRGMYAFDTYTPILRHTAEAACQSANLAYQGALALIRKQTRVAYALCRPPGHHAEYAQMGGYCYFNNAAIAAHLLAKRSKVATLDVDFHHGNGTQHIFATRPDVLTVSIHAHTNWKFPFMAGEEVVPGVIANHNFPLNPGVTNDQYQKILERALSVIAAFEPRYLVVSLGLDTHEADPIGGFKLTTTYYTVMASTIAQLGVPTLIVQEGGYNTELLGENVVAFLKGWE